MLGNRFDVPHSDEGAPKSQDALCILSTRNFLLNRLMLACLASIKGTGEFDCWAGCGWAAVWVCAWTEAVVIELCICEPGMIPGGWYASQWCFSGCFVVRSLVCIWYQQNTPPGEAPDSGVPSSLSPWSCS
ncbi:unnamed protein product [Ostreobium quekettii]|uniref:Uncharacterized protein n=1 Tax=Ostreobium quekettii TaxID=121088 RepID=A0A8S1ISV2_9CHLO|nr:unnamed protein product [Ostreobium quekettii]